MLFFIPMRVLGVQLLHDFAGRHPPVRTWVQSWLAEVKRCTWKRPQDIKDRYRAASIVGQFVIFNVKDCRMATLVAYRVGIVNVKWIGTHDEYMKINWESASNESRGRQD